MRNKRKYFFGWSNIKWLIKELIKIGSDEPSFFSQKRIQQLIAFGVVIWGVIYWLVQKHETMGTSDFVLWAAVPVSIAGYALYHVQKEKPKADPVVGTIDSEILHQKTS